MNRHDLELFRRWIRAEVLSIITQEQCGKLDKWGYVSEEYKDIKDKADLLYDQLRKVFPDGHER